MLQQLQMTIFPKSNKHISHTSSHHPLSQLMCSDIIHHLPSHHTLLNYVFSQSCQLPVPVEKYVLDIDWHNVNSNHCNYAPITTNILANALYYITKPCHFWLAVKVDLWLTCSLCNYKVVTILLACSIIYYIHIHIHYYDLLYITVYYTSLHLNLH